MTTTLEAPDEVGGFLLVDGPSQSLRRMHGAIARDIPRIERGGRFEENDLDLEIRNRAMLDASGDHEEFAGFEFDRAIAELHRETSLVNQEHLVLVLVAVPNKGALELHQLDLLPVEVRRDSRGPVIAERRECRGKVDRAGRHGAGYGQQDTRASTQPVAIAWRRGE